MTARTAMLEARWLWGDEALGAQAIARFRAEVVAGSSRDYVAAKLAERDERHRRMGDSRYVVEPNVKDGKGGLRDLHTLYWIGQYASGATCPADLVGKGLFTSAEFAASSAPSASSGRCAATSTSPPAAPRSASGFDMQRTIAGAMRYADRPGKSAVERFMQFYFLNAKTVGDLTGLFLAQLDEQWARPARFALPALRRRPRRINGFILDRGRFAILSDDWFDDPVWLIELFALRRARRARNSPRRDARAAACDARSVDSVRDDPRANALSSRCWPTATSPT